MNTNLKIARVKCGLTQKELANSVGVTSKYVSLIQRKNLKPSPAVMGKIAKCVGEPVQKLFFSEL